MIDKQVAAKLRQDECLVFNCGGYNTIMFMFYSGKTANGAYPDLQQYLMLKKKKIKMATFVDDNCPLYLLNDPDVKKIYSRLIAF